MEFFSDSEGVGGLGQGGEGDIHKEPDYSSEMGKLNWICFPSVIFGVANLQTAQAPRALLHTLRSRR